MVINFRANRDEDGWAAARQFLNGRVVLDGVELQDVWYVDTDLGLVQQYDRVRDHVTGRRLVSLDGDGRPASRRLRGVVEVYEHKTDPRPWQPPPPPAVLASRARAFDFE